MTDPTTAREQIIIRALEDEEFKQELISNPKPVFERELGEKLPEGFEVRIVQEALNNRYIAAALSEQHDGRGTPRISIPLREKATDESSSLFTSLLIRSLEDDTFKQELLSQPKAVVERELGCPG